MSKPVIVEAVRTPIGKRNGWLAGLHPTQLLALAQTEVIKRAGIEPSMVEQIVGGTQAGDQAANVARNAWLGAGFTYGSASSRRRPVVARSPVTGFSTTFASFGVVLANHSLSRLPGGSAERDNGSSDADKQAGVVAGRVRRL